MKHPVNEQAITVSVGQFIREVRNGNKKPSMFKILISNGVKSPDRARQLIARMLDNHIINKHRDGSFTLCKQNYDMAEIMPILLKRSYTRKAKTVIVEDTEMTLQDYTAVALVEELRSRGYEVKAVRQVITTEEL